MRSKCPFVRLFSSELPAGGAAWAGQWLHSQDPAGATTRHRGRGLSAVCQQVQSVGAQRIQPVLGDGGHQPAARPGHAPSEDQGRASQPATSWPLLLCLPPCGHCGVLAGGAPQPQPQWAGGPPPSVGLSQQRFVVGVTVTGLTPVSELWRTPASLCGHYGVPGLPLEKCHFFFQMARVWLVWQERKKEGRKGEMFFPFYQRWQEPEEQPSVTQNTEQIISWDLLVTVAGQLCFYFILCYFACCRASIDPWWRLLRRF